MQVSCENSRLNLETSVETVWLESGRGEWNSRCSGEMRRYREEHLWRRQLSGTVLTLRRESVGSKQDRILSSPVVTPVTKPAISVKLLLFHPTLQLGWRE